MSALRFLRSSSLTLIDITLYRGFLHVLPMGAGSLHRFGFRAICHAASQYILNTENRTLQPPQPEMLRFRILSFVTPFASCISETVYAVSGEDLIFSPGSLLAVFPLNPVAVDH